MQNEINVNRAIGISRIVSVNSARTCFTLEISLSN